MENRLEKVQHRRITEILKRRIMKGKYSTAEKMPSENELLKEFKVSKNTLLKALNALINQGYIIRRQGSGTFVAPSAAERKNMKIAVIAYHSDNPYYSKIIREIEDFAFQKGFGVVLCNSKGSADKESEYVERFISEVDGFIICPTVESSEYSTGVGNIIESETPLVLVSHTAVNQLTSRADYVLSDSCAGGFLAGKHLAERGYKKMLILANGIHLENEDIKERIKGFKLAMMQNNIAFDDSCIIRCSSKDPDNGYTRDGYEAAALIATDYTKLPLGIFVLSDQMAIGLLRGLRGKNIDVPKCVGICGFDNIELSSQWGIELTTIAQNAAAIGKRSAEILFSILENPEQDIPPEHITIPVELIPRKTTMLK